MVKQTRRFHLGAWIRARFAPKRDERRSSGAKPDEVRPIHRKRLWALVQTRPCALVLAVSDSRENLEAEARELNDTWNHRELRTERHTYELQPVPVLQTGRDSGLRGVGQPGQQQVG